MSFMCWDKKTKQKKQAAALKGQLFLNRKAILFSNRTDQKEYLSVLLSCIVVNFLYRLGCKHTTAAAAVLVTVCSTFLQISTDLKYYISSLKACGDHLHSTPPRLCNMVVVSEGRYSLHWPLPSLELLFISGQVYPRRKKKIWLVDLEETRRPKNR